jgi:hypothetical protein
MLQPSGKWMLDMGAKDGPNQSVSFKRTADFRMPPTTASPAGIAGIGVNKRRKRSAGGSPASSCVA